MQSSGWVSRLAWSTAVAKAEEGSTCACGRSGGGGASGPNRESEPAIIAGGSGGGGSAGVGSEAGGAALGGACPIRMSVISQIEPEFLDIG